MSTHATQTNQSIDELAIKLGGKFRLTRLVALRMRQINQGAPLLVDRRPEESVLAAICREIQDDLVNLEVPEAVGEGEETAFDLFGLGEEGDL